MLALRRPPRAGPPKAGFVPSDPPIFVFLNEVSIIEHLARNRLERVLPDGLRASHFVVLNHLVRLGDGRSPARIARAVQVERPTMTNTIQKLEARGLVRIGPDPRDGRGKLVFLTDAGRVAREAAVAAAAAAIAPIAAGIPANAFEAALPLLRRLRAALDTARDAEEPPEA
jgi:DNA-binding MarR family transcriptional regulator